MPRQPTEQQRLRARRDSTALAAAAHSLRQLASANFYQGIRPYVAYALCGLLDSATRNVDELSGELRGGFLAVARAIQDDAARETPGCPKPGR